MRKAKIFLIGISLIAVLGGIFARTAKQVPCTYYCRPGTATGGTCLNLGSTEIGKYPPITGPCTTASTAPCTKLTIWRQCT